MESAVQTIRDVIKEQRQFWSCLALHDKLLPLEVASKDTGGAEESVLEVQLEQLSLGTSRSVVRSVLVSNSQTEYINHKNNTEFPVPKNSFSLESKETKGSTSVKIDTTISSTTDGISPAISPVQSCPSPSAPELPNYIAPSED